jgi:hypothetical protein
MFKALSKAPGLFDINEKAKLAIFAKF